jgi:hypothetical protein
VRDADGGHGRLRASSEQGGSAAGASGARTVGARRHDHLLSKLLDRAGGSILHVGMRVPGQTSSWFPKRIRAGSDSLSSGTVA